MYSINAEGDIMQEPKPGYETTEFWMSLVVAAIGVLVAAGVITPAQATAAQQQAATWAGALVIVATVITYIVGRVFVKHTAYTAAAAIQSAQASASTASADVGTDPAAGLLDTPPAPRYGTTSASASNPPIRVPSTVGFTDPSTATRASSL
jgi:hypothetical protein